MESYIMTCDAGTTGIKCSAFSRSGKALFERTETYPTLYPAPGWAQQDPDTVLSAAVKGIRSALENLPAAACEALVFSGTMNGCIPLDGEGRPLGPNIIHSDLRAEKQVEQICAAIPPQQYYLRTGVRADVHSGLPKYMWLRQNAPDVYRNARSFVNIKDYLYMRMTGLPAGTDRSDASLCACLDIHAGDWDRDLLRGCGVDPDKMPPLRLSADVSGRLSDAAAAQTGLPSGLPVAAGAGDGACAAHGARVHASGESYMNIGSSAWVSALADEPCRDPEMRLFSYFDADEKRYNICGTVQSAAAAFDWAARNLLGACDASGKTDVNALEKTAASVPPGSEGVMFLPTLAGERTPWWTAKVSGTLMGFTLYHERRHAVRAVYEGVMQALNLCGDILRENGLPQRDLTLIGGGAQSELWGQMAADMFGVPVRIHASPRSATSLGAALIAGTGIGWYRDYEEASRYILRKKEYIPDPDRHALYRKHLAVYRRLYPDMQKAYEALYDFTQEEKQNEQ
ncbi:MAG: hypothetical protein J5564_06020 [Clostridia bacterium]|nr:hypothetical protein [Clostridia bacterium]